MARTHQASTGVATLVRRSRSTFTYAFRFLPKREREAIHAVYAFCRAIDDIADETGDVPDRAERLKAWREEVDRCFAGTPTHPIAVALARSLDDFPIPKQYFEELIAGVEMDLTRNRYRTFEDLYQYCYRVASVVGLMCIEIFGYTSPRTREYAVSLGIALQLTNILRDLKTDAERGRLYLPQEDLHRFGVPEGDILGGHITPALLALMRFEAERAGGYFEAADRLLPSQDRPRLYAAEIMGIIYRRTLEEIVARDFPVFTERVSLPGWYKMSLAITIWLVSRVVHHLRRH